MPVYKHNRPSADGRIWRFQVSYKTPEGKYRSYKSGLYATKKEAEKEEARWILEHKDTGKASLLSFNDVIPQFLAEKKATIKPQSYDREVVLCNHVSSLIGAIAISKMTATQYENFRAKVLATDWSVNYKNKVVKQLKYIINYAGKKYGIYNDIPSKYKAFTDPTPKKPMQIFTLPEFERFIIEIKEPRYNAFFTALMFTGMRLNEANALTWNDVDFEKQTININKSLSFKLKSKDGLFLTTTPKTPNSIRVIPLPKRLAESLKTLPRDGDYVFGGVRPLPETTITKQKDDAIKKAGLHRIRVHDFRHSYTSMLVNTLGVDNILLVSRLLGHSDIKETLRTYSHLWSSAYDDYLSKINSI